MVDEDELEKIREQKRKELQENDETEDQHIENQKRQIWGQAVKYMTENARERLANIKTVDENKAMAVAQQITRLGKTGQIKKVNESQMKEILKSISGQKDDQDIKFRK